MAGTYHTGDGGEPPVDEEGPITHDIGSVLGNYKLLEVIGEGGVGRVYLAEHTRLGRKVALKTLRANYAHNPAVVKRFFAEARAVNQIAHKNIVEITDFIEDDDAAFYIMELLQGSVLSQILEEGLMPISRLVKLATQICDGLEAAHSTGIVHRDLKPDNVFVVQEEDRQDFVKLLDFGVAKLLGTLSGDRAQTAQGMVLGTPDYMSPEQAQGETIDHRTDVYALGVMLFEMVTGKKPFGGKSVVETLTQQIVTPPPPPSTIAPGRVPPPLEDLILRCLAKDPDGRPWRMMEIKEELLALNDVSAGATQDGRLAAFVEPPFTSHSRRLAPLAAAAAVVVAAAGIGGYLYLGADTDKTALRAGSGKARMAGTEKTSARAGTKVSAAKVTVQFDSEPAGAEVYSADGKLLGRTPFSASLPHGDKAQVFEFRREGHKVARREAVLQGDFTRVLARLEALPAQVPSPRKAARARPSRPKTSATRQVSTEKKPPDVTASKKGAKKVEKKKRRVHKSKSLNPFDE